MKKSTKGALATGAAAVLLVGGAGTLAYWSDDASVNGGSFNTGDLSIEPLGTPPCDAAWVYAGANTGSGIGGAGDPVTEIAPGDTITKDCTFTVVAEGDNLSATLGAPDTVTFTDTPDAPSLQLDVDATYDLGGTAVDDGDVITEDADGDTLTVTFEVAFPSGTAQNDPAPVNINDTRNLSVALSQLTVTLTQTS